MKTDRICGFTFAPFSPAGVIATEEAKESLGRMKELTASNFVIFAPAGYQDNATSEEIDFTSIKTVKDEELKDIINEAHSLGLKVALKPTVNCKDGTWRAHIHFFDEDVVCEPKWGNWFKSYTEFQLHYAELAKETGCEMFIAGCEMVMSDHREKEWRRLISDIKTVYDGPVSYNCDKYQEHNVSWWDAVDVISSSGYYPIDDWERQLDRIEEVVKKFNKPFFFAETGCMSTKGSAKVPNNWELDGGVDLMGQKEWYEKMFEAVRKRDFVSGVVLWSWTADLYDSKEAEKEPGYDVFAKPAMDVISNNFNRYQHV
ncbi:MAG: 1,4-beta-xylanase [Lachnospiraceae bacterium]|nr:1,4-beta-xylanase [Lachnospiraceae bacterium]